MKQKSYKEEFNKWVKERKIEVFQNLSDVLPDSPYDLKVGQTCTFRNYVFLDFHGYTIMGFCKLTSWGACVYLDCDSFWHPARPEMILLDGTTDQQCNVKTTFENNCTILTINRVRCVLQSYIVNDFVNLSPIQTGRETLEEELHNVRIDFLRNTIDTDGKRTIKWHNFTRTIDIEEIRKAIIEIESNKCPVCNSKNTRKDYDSSSTMRCCKNCGSDFTICGEVTLNAREIQ